MGCDIHLHQEVMIKGKWQHYAVCHIGRDYELFGKMAGVRGGLDCDPISEPKGVPKDLTLLTRIDLEKNWGSDAHSMSWFGAEEIKILEDWYMKRKGEDYDTQRWMVWADNFGYLFGNNWADHLRYDDSAQRLKSFGVEDVRWIFWFDN